MAINEADVGVRQNTTVVLPCPQKESPTRNDGAPKMTAHARRRHPTLTVSFILVLSALTTLATSREDGPTSASAQLETEWRGETQQVGVRIDPVGDRLETYEYDGPLYLDLEVMHIAQVSAETVRWTLTVDSAEPRYVADGGFTFGGETNLEDNGLLFGDLSARLGKLCNDDEGPDDGCIPCDVEAGCTIKLDIDRCHSNGDELTRTYLHIAQEEGDDFGRVCDGSGICEQLRDWMTTISQGPLPERLCQE